MKKTIVIFWFGCCLPLLAASVDLSGPWDFALDPRDQGLAEHWWEKPFHETITLPGTVSESGRGTPLSMQPVLPPVAPEALTPKRGITFGRAKNYAVESAALMHLYPRFSYTGPAWYRRVVDIPDSWADKDVTLALERTMWETRLWVNGRDAGRQNSLITPHRYEIGAMLHPGRNEIVVRIDNRRQLAIGNPHAYTDETQTIWNGVIGKIQLVAREKVRVTRMQFRPDLARHGVAITLETHNPGQDALAVTLALRASPENFRGISPPAWQQEATFPPGDGEQTLFYPMGEHCQKWSEFTPRLYRMKAVVTAGALRSETTGTFGLREFKVAGAHFSINGQPVFLRGTVESCVFPKTGYPDMTGKEWRKIFSEAKACGLNHFRFHTWCPPEVAFELADEFGLYLQVELPDWCFHIGEDAAVTEFFRQEGERMIREYGNHPSWVMFTMGNELKGDYAVLDQLETHFRALDPQLLYSSTTYPSSPRGKTPEPPDDYYISLETTNGRVRGQYILNDTMPNTISNYSAAASALAVPLVSHEVGQYCVYPNPAEIPKYAALRPIALEAIRDDLRKKNRLGEAPAMVRDSGQLALLLYKEEVERALRTTNQAGFQLLAMNDFPGQGTSTVGPFDAFWDSKKLITPAEFREFCAPIVPLALLPKRVYQNNETFAADLEMANFGPAPLTNAAVIWKICKGRKKIASGAFNSIDIPLGPGIAVGRIEQALTGITRAAKLTFTVSVAGADIVNHWEFWVYPAAGAASVPDDVVIFQSAGEAFYQALRDGKKVLLQPQASGVKSPLAAAFTPVFWNPVMFPNQPGSMGAMIDARQPMLADFPTDPWSNWQWWELLHHSFSIDLDSLQPKPVAPVRFVDEFNRNAFPAAIFEARVGAGRLVVCTLDITSDPGTRPVARQLRESILHYMTEKSFRPRVRLTPADLNSLFVSKPGSN